MIECIDTNHNFSTKYSTFYAQGGRYVGRYDNRLGPNGEKQLKPAEARQARAANVEIFMVYEGQGDKVSAFSKEMGYKDAAYSRQQMTARGQPSGSGMYFAADSDFSRVQEQANIGPYFEGVAQANAEKNGLPTFIPGVYGSGLSCETMLAAKLAELFWISCSGGWTDTHAFVATKQHHLKQDLPKLVLGVDTDPNEINKSQFGAFLPFGTVDIVKPLIKNVSAKSGLNLRDKPINGKIIKLLPYDTKVVIIKDDEKWPMVDVDMDGKPDGYVSATYLVMG